MWCKRKNGYDTTIPIVVLYLDGQMRFPFNLLTLTPLRYTKAQFFAYSQFLRHCIFRLLWIGLITASNIWTRTPYFVLGTLLFDSFLQILDLLLHITTPGLCICCRPQPRPQAFPSSTPAQVIWILIVIIIAQVI